MKGIQFSGPFFERDPKKTYQGNVRDFMDEVAKLGEREVVAALRKGEGRRAPIRGLGRVSHYVRGRTRSLGGKRWRATAVVSTDTSGLSRRDAIAVKAAASQIEGREHVFRRIASRIRRVRTDLLKGLR